LRRSSRELVARARKPILCMHRVNTRKRLRLAEELGISLIEFDVKARSGRLVVEHGVSEPPLRSPMAKTVVMWMEREILGEPRTPMDLEEYLSRVSKRFRLWIDLKVRGFERELIELLDRYGVREPVIVSSGYYDSLLRIKELAPWVCTFLGNVAFYPITNAVALEARADGMSVSIEFVDRALVERLHRDGLFIAVWTVNSGEEARELASMGVDVIITDFPDRVAEALGLDPSENPFL